jgi:flagellar hook-length control protein FliK
MMPAITLTPLPALLPFQFLPEAELNFDAVLESVAAPALQAPAMAERVEPDETLLSFLGNNPVKAKAVDETVAMAKEESYDDAGDAAPTPVVALTLPLPPLISQTIQVAAANTPPSPIIAPSGALPKPAPPFSAKERGNTSTSSVRKELGVIVSPRLSEDAITAPDTRNPLGLSPSKPSLSLNAREEGSTSTGSVQTELGGIPSTIMQLGLAETKASALSQSIASTPTTDPLRFVVERQLDLARDSRWLDALARDILAVADTPDRLSFRLSPPHLGQLDVDLSTSESGLSVRMNASTEAATQIVAAAQPRLIDELKSQGVRVAEAQVSTGGGQSQGQGQQQQRDADQMIEFMRQRFERAEQTNLTRPTGRFA